MIQSCLSHKLVERRLYIQGEYAYEDCAGDLCTFARQVIVP